MTKSIGLRTEILMTLTLLMGTALLLGGLLMLHLTEQSLLEQKVAQLRLHTQTIARSLAESYDPALSEIPFNTEIVKQLPAGMLYDGWWLYSQDLAPLAIFAEGRAEPFSQIRLQQVRLSGQAFESVKFPPMLLFWDEVLRNAHFIEPIQSHGQILGLLEISYSLDDIRQRLLLSQRLILIYVVLYGMVLVLVGYYLLQRNVIRPARDLVQATEKVGSGNLETWLPVAGPTEIAQLASSYNNMVEALRRSHAESEAHIAALEKANRELHRTRDELIRSEKLASVGQLAAGLAHELGNPLAAVIGYLELLKHQLLEGAQKDIVGRSLAETARIDFLVRELLDFSRPDENAQIEGLNIAEVLWASVQLLSNQGALGKVEIIETLPKNLALVRVNRNKLQQVFVNILLNAVQACGDTGWIKLTGGQGEKAVWVSIEDSGDGIAESDMLKIFDPFYTTKPVGQGTGLGLTICQRIVAEMRGSIEVVPSPLGGGGFRVILPEM
ncbi:sensor histidine kinase [Malonomonas rubra]|uniref:sensor histidine kinase n=1 Tax=Malonomonas rubra TaxID=57040 RepID=UPI0026F052AF|nr:ATP-binding protein [Malonomonas rubra]